MERKKRSKGSVWECCYANKMFGTFGDEIKAYGRNWSNFARTHTHAAKLVVEIIIQDESMWKSIVTTVIIKYDSLL